MANIFDSIPADGGEAVADAPKGNVFDNVPTDNVFDHVPDKPPLQIKLDPIALLGERVHMPSAMSSGWSSLPPSSDGPNADDWGFTKAAFASPGTDIPSRIGQGFKKAGDLAVGTLADAGQNIVSPMEGYHTENMEAAWKGEPLPTADDVRSAGLALRLPAEAAQGLIQTAPQMAATMAVPEAAPIIWGSTPEGFDPKQALLATALPVIGKYSGAITEAIASKLGVSSETALQVLNRAGGATGATAAIGADQAYQIMQLPPDQRHEALIDSVANAAGMMVLGVMGERHQFGKDGIEAPEPMRIDPRAESPIPVETPSENVFDTMPSESTAEAPSADALASLQSAMRGNQLKPVDTSRVEVRTPDGQVDHVETAIARMKLEQQQAPSEPMPVEEPAPVETSQPEAGTTVSPAPVASEISRPEGEAQEKAPAAVVSSAAAPEQSAPTQRDLDEQNALETVQEAVGLNKVQSARLAELQAKNSASLTSQPESATKAVAAPGTDTVRTAGITASNESQRGQFPAPPVTAGKGDMGVTAEGGSNPPLGAAVSPSKSRQVSRADAQRPFDLIDHVEGEVGTIDPTLIKEANPDWKPVGAARKLFKKGGTPADSALNALGTGHGVTPDMPLDQFGDALNSAGKARIGWRKQFYSQERQINEEARQTSTFQKDISQATKKTETLVPDDLNEGDQFTLKGAKFKVTRLDYDEDGRVTHLTLDDGKKYGTQEVDGQTALRMDKDSLEKGSPPSDKEAFARGEGQQRGLATQPVTEAIQGMLGTEKLPAGIRVVRDETAKWGARIEGRNNIVVNAAQISTVARARQVILEEGLHGVWNDPAVQHAWQSVRDLVTPDEMNAERTKRQAQGLPTDAATIREEAAIARLVKADANRGTISRVFDAIRAAFKRIFGFDLPGSYRQQLKDAALEFLRNRDDWQGARGEFEVPSREQLGQQEIERLPGQQRLYSGGDKHAAGDFTDKAKPERERSVEQVKSEFAQAEKDLKTSIKSREGKPRAEYQQELSLATAKYRTLRDELLHHPDYIAEQLLKQHQAITEANEILKPHNMAMRPEEYPNPNRLREILTPEQVARVDELQSQVDASHQELSKMPKKMVSRIYGEMQDDGRLPKSPAMTDLGAGRTLDRMTQFLKENDFDSPKGTFAERLALGKRFADTVSGVKDTVTKAMLKSQAAWKAMVESFKRPPTDDDYRSAKKSWISYDQRTAHENYQYAKALTDKVPLKVRRNAMSVWLDADGDESLLKFQRDSVPDKYREIWDAALKLTPDEKRIALDVKANFAAKLDDAIATGLVEKGREDYGVPQRWKTAPEIGGAQDPFGEGKKGKPGNPYAKLDPRDPFFSFQRQTPSYFEGIMAKGEPENLDIAHLVTVYDAGFHKALGSRGWIAALQDAGAKDGLPVVKISGKASMANNEGGKAYFVDSKAHAPGDVTADGRPYRAIDHFALRDWKVAFKDEAGNPIIVKGDMLVHPDYFDDVKNELETPKWTMQGIGGAALKVSSFLKSSKFIGPFHIVTEALHASFHGVVPSVRGFDIDLQDPKQSLIARNMTLGFGKAREMFEDGLASHGGIWAHVPGLGEAVVRMNNFTFNEYIPRLKMKVGLAVLARNEARYAKELTPEQIGELTGRQMDAAFGGQNWRLIGANKSTLAVMRLGLVAPDFLISRAKVIGQAFKPYNQEQRVFLVAQAVGVYALCRVLNSIFSEDHDAHFEPKNWDSVVIGKRAYHARFIVSDAANLARDLMGLGSFNQHGIPFITGRLGVVPKIGMEVASGKDLFTGQNKDGLFQTDNPLFKAFSIVAQDTAEWMTPMGVDGFLPGAAAKGQTGLGSAVVATVGVSSRKESPANDVWDMARQFNLQSKNPATVAYQKQRDNDTGTPSVYRGLNNLLDAGQLDKAKQEVQALQAQGKTISQIVSHYERNVYFTGSAAREQQFYAGLTPAQQKQYQSAKAEQRERAGALMKALSAK